MKIPKKIKNYKVVVDNKLKWFGDTSYDKKIVRINKKKSLKAGGQKELKDTILHEKQHVLHPQMHEKNVQKRVKAIMARTKQHTQKVKDKINNKLGFKALV